MYAPLFLSFLALGALMGRSDAIAVSNRLHTLLHDKCEKNGAMDQVPVIEAGVTTFKKCVINQINIHALHEVTLSPPERKPLKVLYLIESMCPDRYSIMQCVDNMIDLTSPCIDPKTTSFPAIKIALKDIVEYICADNARVANQMFDDGVTNCTDLNITRLHGCMDNLYAIQANNSQMFACQKYDVIKNCVENFFKKCQKPTITDFVKNVMSMWYKGSNCNGGPEVETNML